MDPKSWGPPAWKFLHSITLAYPLNPTKLEKINMLNFFKSVGKVLPCNMCRTNYSRHLSKLPLTDDVLSSRDGLVQWLIRIHDMVNNDLGKNVKKEDNKLFFLILIVVIMFYMISKKNQ